MIERVIRRILCLGAMHEITTATNPRTCVHCDYVQPKWFNR